MHGQDEREFVFSRRHPTAQKTIDAPTPTPSPPHPPPLPFEKPKQTSADAFTALVARCPVLNVRTRDPALPPVDTGHFSCFGVFEDPEAFRAYANGTASAPKGSYAAKSGAAGGVRVGGGFSASLAGVVVAAVAVAVLG